MGPALGRRLWLIVVAALVLTGILVFVSGRGATARVAVTDVVRENLSSVVSTNGKVEPVMPISSRASFPTFVKKVYAVEGQQVKRGQLLFALDDAGVRADLAQARADLAAEEEALRVAKSGGRADQMAKIAADLEKAKALREQLRRDNESLINLVAQKAATPHELEANRLALAQAEADVQSLEKAKQTYVSQARLDMDRVALLVEHARNQVRDLEGKMNSTHGTAVTNGTLYSLPIHQGDFVKEEICWPRWPTCTTSVFAHLLMSPNSGRSISTRRWRFSGTRIPIAYGAAAPRWSRNKWLPMAHATSVNCFARYPTTVWI